MHAHDQPAGSSGLNCNNTILKNHKNHYYGCVLPVRQTTLPSMQAFVGIALMLIFSWAVWGIECRDLSPANSAAILADHNMMPKSTSLNAENQYHGDDHKFLERSDPYVAANSAREEKEREFMEWVERVRTRTNTEESSRDSNNTNGSSGSSNIWSDGEAVGNVITVNPSGGADFSSIQAAVDSIPTKNAQRIVIQMAAGVYQEKVFVPKNKPFITFQGAGKDATTIVWHDTKADAGKTQNSATVGVNSDGFIAKGITFKNSAPAPGPGAVGAQAVAMRISGDKAAFYGCGFLGAQDTLYDDHGRHYFENCYIEGSIDFIFGDGQSMYEGCTLHALAVNPGSLTAQKRSSPGESTGFSMVRCSVTGSGMMYLGRAWGPYSRVVFSFCYLADIIIPQGWFDWGDPSRQNTVFYGEYKCSGPGANQNGRVAWSHELTDAQAAPFQTLSFIDGTTWLNT